MLMLMLMIASNPNESTELQLGHAIKSQQGRDRVSFARHAHTLHLQPSQYAAFTLFPTSILNCLVAGNIQNTLMSKKLSTTQRGHQHLPPGIAMPATRWLHKAYSK